RAQPHPRRASRIREVLPYMAWYHPLTPRGFLQWGGIVLTLLGIVGFLGIFSKSAVPSFYLDTGENVAHLGLGVIALAALYVPADSAARPVAAPGLADSDAHVIRPSRWRAAAACARLAAIAFVATAGLVTFPIAIPGASTPVAAHSGLVAVAPPDGGGGELRLVFREPMEARFS